MCRFSIEDARTSFIKTCVPSFPVVPHQATGVREDQLLVTVLPGLPTAAEFFLLPDKQLTEGKPDKSSVHLDQVNYNRCSVWVCNIIMPFYSSWQCLCRWIDCTLLSSLYFNHNPTVMFETFFPFVCLCESQFSLSLNAAFPVIAHWKKKTKNKKKHSNLSSSFLQQMPV